MTVCLKCGAENPSTNEHCARCELPLPRGAGGTLLMGMGAQPSPKPSKADPDPSSEAVVANGVTPEAPPVLERGSSGAARDASPHGTLFGMAPSAPSSTEGGRVQRTLFGMPTPGAALPRKDDIGGSPAVAPRASASHGAARAAPPPPEPAPPLNAQRTLLGIAPSDLARALELARAAPPPSSQLEPALGNDVAPPPEPGAFEPVRNATTILGSAPPRALAASAPAQPESRAQPEATAQPESTAQPAVDGRAATQPLGASRVPVGGATPPFGSPAREPFDGQRESNPSDERAGGHARTQLGVALPGIAPIRGPIAAPGAAVAAPGAPTVMEDAPEAPPPSPSSLAPASDVLKGRLPKGALVLLGSGVVLLLAAAAFALLWKPRSPLAVALASDPAGNDRIDLICDTCPDGTRITLGAASAEVREQKAYLVPEKPLPLGESTVAFTIERPGTAPPERADVRLPPVEYRITPDTSTLGQDEPRVTLKIAAVPGTTVQLAGAPAVLDAAGNGSVAVDLGAELQGPASEVTNIERKIPYEIRSPTAQVYTGELRIAVGVTPLLLEAPGADTVTDMERFMVAGRTTKGATISVAGSPLRIDDEGRFAQLMSIDAIGETRVTVRAMRPGLAPRFVSFRLERVKDLAAAARRLGERALPLSRALADLDANLGRTVSVKGKVEEVRVDGHRKLVLLQASGDCEGRGCLIRLAYGGLRQVQRGATLTAIGRLQRAAGAVDVPELDVSLLL